MVVGSDYTASRFHSVRSPGRHTRSAGLMPVDAGNPRNDWPAYICYIGRSAPAPRGWLKVSAKAR